MVNPLYIDPGTGSLLLSVVLGALMTLVFTLRGFFYKTFYFIIGKKYKGVNDFTGQLVFYNEGSNYWNVFKPVLENVIKAQQPFVYLSSDETDPGLKIESPHCNAHFIGKMDQAFLVLNKLKAAVCVMTTPQLNILRLRRSSDVQHYAYLAHAPNDVHGNKKFAFDYYDSVFCGNDFHIESLRLLEKKRNTQEKLLLKTGCTYYDEMPEVTTSERDSILLVPTWGDRTFLTHCGEAIIEKLLECGHKVILRPHPQSWISDKEVLNKIVSGFQGHERFEMDRSSSNSVALSKAKLIICDITSGIIYDFSFLQKKPVIAVDFDWKDGGYESSNLDNITCTDLFLKKVGKVISAKDIPHLDTIIDDLEEFEMPQALMDEHIVNFRKAGPVAAKQILEIYESVQK